VLNKTQAIIPGPGRYEPLNKDILAKNHSPKFGFGTGGRPDLATGAPSSLSKQRSVSDGKGHSSSPTLRVNVPGPGTYEIKQVVGNEGPKRSLAGRFKVDLTSKELAFKPGPGQYSPTANASLKSSPNYRIGSSLREKYYLADKFKHELPPPNIYDPDFKKVI
jgi:hypothetical protein